ncbi:hypothetical protein BKA83DRAFT_4286036 [Pisolithus microcarpus]|nr:hypothetical protein BKA83DRAFT_4286036 [Pisolithus microcarpus]
MGIPGGFGSTLVGGLVSAMLYGITTLQGRLKQSAGFAYMYCMRNFEDTSTMKFMVAAVWVLDTLHVSFVCHMEYYYLITNWGAPTSLEYIVWFVCLPLQNSFLLMRRDRSFPVRISDSLRGTELERFPAFINSTFSFASYTRFYTTTPAAIAIALAEVLITRTSNSAVPRTKRLLNTLVIYAVNRLYANSLLASLNTRQYLRSHSSGPESDLCMNAVHFASPPNPLADVKSSRDEVRQFAECKAAVIDITTKLAFD